jgi:hypothetical protein
VIEYKSQKTKYRGEIQMAKNEEERELFGSPKLSTLKPGQVYFYYGGDMLLSLANGNGNILLWNGNEITIEEILKKAPFIRVTLWGDTTVLYPKGRLANLCSNSGWRKKNRRWLQRL